MAELLISRQQVHGRLVLPGLYRSRSRSASSCATAGGQEPIPSAAEPKAMVESIAYYGTYTVNEAKRFAILHLEAGTFPNQIGALSPRPRRSRPAPAPVARRQAAASAAVSASRATARRRERLLRKSRAARERSEMESQSPRNQSPQGQRGATQRPGPAAPSQRPLAAGRGF